ncbi:MAG: group II intron reverse transcriptase/maturase [Alphaproteobacteria bacterium]|nr:group II intron reverse transcriptase/maturase [Alphaproteobacteria bacterium]
MGLTTPEKIRSLQRKLYVKAKAEPAFRFYLLYDKICRADILLHAYRLARANAGAPGVDGMTFDQIEAQGLEAWLAGLREDLVAKTYRPDPVRRVMIPKASGDGERPLGIATIRDRVVQAAAKIVLEPIFEADFEDTAYGYRPRRGALAAVKEVHRHLIRGNTDVVDADLSRYFDSIPHSDLLKSVARRVVDRNVLRLIKMWLRSPVEERDADGTRRMSGGKGNKLGTPQGAVVSPLLANIYMNRFLKHFRQSGAADAFRAHVVAYADDLVILSRGRAAEALTWMRDAMAKLGLTLNEAKTSLKDALKERFDFLGYSFGPHWFKKNGKWYLGASPSKKSMQRFKTKVGDRLVPANVAPWEDVRDELNSMLLGWSHYFSYGATAGAYKHVDWHVYQRARDFLTRRHKVQGRGTARFSCDVVYGELGLIRLERLPRSRVPAVGRT